MRLPEYLWLFPGRESQTSTEPLTRFLQSYYLSHILCSDNCNFSPFFIFKVVGTALLLFAISAINNPANSAVSSRCHFRHNLTICLDKFACFWTQVLPFCLSLGPLLVGLVVVNIGICFGHNAGYVLIFSGNPHWLMIISIDVRVWQWTICPGMQSTLQETLDRGFSYSLLVGALKLSPATIIGQDLVTCLMAHFITIGWCQYWWQYQVVDPSYLFVYWW